MPGKIYNPATGRMVAKTGMIGREILKEQIKVHPNTDDTHIINPKTGRPVKKTGKIGQAVLQGGGNKPHKWMSEHELERKYGKIFIRMIPDGYRVSKQLGKGSYGTVYLLCSEDSDSTCNLVIKVQKKRHAEPLSEFKLLTNKEVELHKHFYKAGLTEKYYEHAFFEHYGEHYSIILMGRIDEILNGWMSSVPSRMEIDTLCKTLVRAIDALIKKMCRYNLTHGDMHADNIGLMHRGDHIELVLLDFGWASQGGCCPKLELAQLVRCFLMDRHEFRNNAFYKCLKKQLHALYEYYVQSEIPCTISRYTAEHISAHKHHESGQWKEFRRRV